MKKFIHTIIAVLAINTSIMAQHGFEVQKELIINVSAEELWTMVGPGFIDVYKWSSNVDHAEGSGEAGFEGAVCSERVCDLNVKGFNSISEKLTKYSVHDMSLAYAVTAGMPGFVTKAVNDWTVVPMGKNQSKLVMKGEFNMKGMMGWMMKGMMEKKMNTTLETVLNDAKVYVETGNISAAKQIRMAELATKSKKAA